MDAYPDLVLSGHVDSLAAATGSEFSVLPAQNATGNWVKVVQRAPVQQFMGTQGAGLSGDNALALLNQELTRPSAAVGYLNDFQIMAWMTLAAIPLILFFRSPPPNTGQQESAEAERQEA